MALPPLTRLLMVAEWLDAHAEMLDMAEANAEVLREVARDLAAALPPESLRSAAEGCSGA